jgi:hypothetical protein
MSGDWTIQRLNETDDIDFAITILNERRNHLTNQYAPLAQKIGKAIGTLNRLKEKSSKKRGDMNK